MLRNSWWFFEPGFDGSHPKTAEVSWKEWFEMLGKSIAPSIFSVRVVSISQQEASGLWFCSWTCSRTYTLEMCVSKCVENLKNNPMGINEWLEGYLKWLIWTEIFHSISFTTLGWALIHTSFRALVQTLNIDNRWKSHSWKGTSWEITPGPRWSVKHENNSYLKLKWCVVHYSGNSHTAGQSHVR